MVIHIVRFRSSLPDDRIAELFQVRASEYLAVPGLLQKYYLHFRSGEHGGVYVWDSAASMERFMASRLARTICDVYRVDDSVRDVADVVFALYPPASEAGSEPRLRLVSVDEQGVIRSNRDTL